jgi:hypothetical protein
MISRGLAYFDRVGVPFFRVGMIATGLECFRQRWNAFDRVEMPSYTVLMPSRGLECLPDGWNSSVQSWNAF